jgi:hypothetical protein
MIILFILMNGAVLAGCAAQTFTMEVEPSGTKIVRGYFERSLLEDEPAFSWFKTNYDAFQYDSAVVAQIAPLTEDVHVVMIVGTWCGDSKRELPKQFRILDAVNFPQKNVTMFGVDRSKKSQDSTTYRYNVLRVPTMIVFRGEQELGRIVEYPRASQEVDLLRLLNK